MKKSLFFAIAAAAVVCAPSCTREKLVEESDNLVEVSFTALGEETSKVSLDFAAAQNTNWENSDKVAVFDGSGKRSFSVKAGTNTGATATFTGKADGSADAFYAVYPYSAASKLESSLIEVTVPSKQTIAAGACVDPAALVAVASAAPKADMAFKQVCGLLKITLTETGVTAVTVNGVNLSGTVQVTAAGAVETLIAPETSITLTHASGTFPKGTYYMAVLPSTSAAGKFSIAVLKGSTAGVKTASGSVVFARAKGLDAGSLTGLETYTVIKSGSEFAEWNSERVAADEQKVVLGADIDMEGEVWIPKDFTGTFNGLGHRIYNMDINRSNNACLFNNLYGTFCNLVFGSSDGKNYDSTSRIFQENPDAESGTWHYAALIVRLNDGASMVGVTNFAPVIEGEESTAKCRIGGLVAVIPSSAHASISNCVNNGDISNLAEEPLANGNIGGIIGHGDGNVTCTNVVNNGNITVTHPKIANVGGILSVDGNKDNPGASSFTNCINNGNITLSSTGTNNTSVGGIVGDAFNTSIRNCNNTGSITIAMDGEHKVGGIIGRAYIGCSCLNCVNGQLATIDINPTATFTKQAFIGGIVGNAPAANNSFLNISGCTNYADLTSTARNTATVAGIAGYLNMSTGTAQISNCYNYGDIRRSSDVTTQGASKDVSVAGIAGHLRFSSGTVSNCINYGDVWTSTNQGNTTSRIGGIVAFAYSNVEVTSCINKGDVAYEMGPSDKTVGSTVHVGGIVGHLTGSSSVEASTNEGEITSNRRQVNRVGGIVGTANSSGVYTSTNKGNVNVTLSGTVASWQAVGGIVGFGEGDSGSRVIKDNTNQASVVLMGNMSPAGELYVDRIGTAGIIGVPYTGFTITGNKNKGSISCANENTDTPNCGAGGIIGTDVGSTSASSYTKNTNYGYIQNATAVAGGGMAGGLFGYISNASSVTNNKTYGGVRGNVGGAVAGLSAVDMAVTLCDAVTVNNVLHDDAESEARWLCPAGTGVITPTFVAHSDSE